MLLPTIPGGTESNRNSDSSETVHDYAEIYTPSREGVNWNQGNGSVEAPRPPTPPLHRFPSWEAKIYQVLKVNYKSKSNLNIKIKIDIGIKIILKSSRSEFEMII